jgi:Zn-dependent peptidase ImmA (M78 family)
MMRVEVKPELLRWARERAGYDLIGLARRFPKLGEWEQGATQPTFKQLENFAQAMHTPIGFLFLQEPPVERLPIPDFRTVHNQRVTRPSPDLLDTVYICQQRQEWYRDFVRSIGEPALSFVGSANLKNDIVEVAARMRDTLKFDLEERRQSPTWADALRRFIEQTDAVRVLVMCNGVVLNNASRKLDPDEFRGFALSDSIAPLVFINGADTRAAQMFTLAHELAHIWLGQSAVSDAQASQLPKNDVERWCNQVAAEFLAPLNLVRGEYQKNTRLGDEIVRLARRFKVSTLVALRRIHDIGGLTQAEFRHAYEIELERLLKIPKSGSGGGDFYRTQTARVGKRFARALVVSTLEGQTLHRDAFRMLGFSKLKTFHELGRSLGVVA